MMKNKSVCIHGHFYQPPRENPWLNEVEMQSSAYPYHDWNHRITAECYARNAASRILDEEGRIEDIVNNYARISFNFGPTLLEWMERHSPDVYQAILKADRLSLDRFNGHGSAMAQAYNHSIMPLNSEKDKHTQVIWGIRDFEYRFQRKPEGMWLPETAVDTPTLEVLAEHEIQFTILSPFQAQAVRKIGEEEWEDVSDGAIDPKKVYLYNLPSGRTINLFFYDGPISQGIAFEGLLNNGNEFARRLTSHFADDDSPELMNIATDGETYGHHHPYGEMALSYALDQIEHHDGADLTNYAQFLAENPPEQEVKVIEPSSWSCAHGVERWRSDCDCTTGTHPEWHQKWRKPLRDAFDWLRSQIDPLYEKQMKKFVEDPWQLRDEYIEVILDRSYDNNKAFIEKHAGKGLPHDRCVTFLKLLEMQYHGMLMYTSCGWFFEEVTGIETMQDIMYAARAIQLAQEVTFTDFETTFLEYMEYTPSNIPEHGHAAHAYHEFVEPTRIDLLRVGAHYAVSSLFKDYAEEVQLYSFKAKTEYYDTIEAGMQKMGIGRVLIHSDITWEEQLETFAVLHLGYHNLFGGVRPFETKDKFNEMHQEVKEAFQKSNVHEVLNLIDNHFGTHNYSFWHLFKDDQREILDQVLGETVANIEHQFQEIYDYNYPVLQAVNELHMDFPKPLKLTFEFVVNAKLREQLMDEEIDWEELEKRIDEVNRMHVELDQVTISFMAGRKVSGLMEIFADNFEDVQQLEKINYFLEKLLQLPLNLDLWEAQNTAFYLCQDHYEAFKAKADKGEKKAKSWVKKFEKLFELLGLKL